MQRLKSEDHALLSENVIKCLFHNRITTVLDFLQEESDKLSRLTKLSLPQVLEIRGHYFNKYSAPVVNGSFLYVASILNTLFLRTEIEGLDNITSGGIPVGYITEVCGLANSGKTQLCHQLAINLVRNSDATILYIDTKGDFSAIRIQKILDAYGCSHKDMAQIMLKIKIVNIWTMDELIEFVLQLKRKVQVIDKLCLIIVDSLPSLMLQYLGDDSKFGLSSLNIFVNHCKYLCKELEIGFICINLQTRWVDRDVEYEDDECPANKETITERRHRCLGKYWQHIPALVILLEKTENKSKSCCDLRVKVVKSTFNKNNLSCSLNLNHLGVF